jgi:VanZ family protein
VILSGDLGSSANTLSLLHRFLGLFAALSPQEAEAVHYYARKLGHLTAYAILYLLCFRALKLHFPGRPWLTCLAALALSVLVAALDEGRQSLVHTRHGSLNDVVLDLAGMALAASLIPGLWRPGEREPAPGGR